MTTPPEPPVDPYDALYGLEPYQPPPSGEWLRRRGDERPEHHCFPPYDRIGAHAAGTPGDIWRCRCGRTWRLADRTPPHWAPYVTFPPYSYRWERVRWWQVWWLLDLR